MALSFLFRDPNFSAEFEEDQEDVPSFKTLPKKKEKVSETAWKPTMDIKDNGKEILIQMELPGISKENINVNFAEEELCISGERKMEKSDKYLRHERSFGSFKRKIPIPSGIQETDIKASFTNGVLELVFPNGPAQPESKKIAIN
jgi:HSP20 family protein